MNQDEGRHETAATGPAHESDSVDVFQVLRRGWLGIVVFTSVVTILVGVYYSKRSELNRAEMLLDDKEYEIQFIEETKALYPVWQHRQLGESTQFLARVTSRMQAERLWAREGSVPRLVFDLNEMDRRLGPIRVTCRIDSREAAVRGLEIWAEEYLKAVPRYRARKLLDDLVHETNQRAPGDLEADAVLARMERRLAAMVSSNGVSELELKAVAEKLAALKVEKMARAHEEDFSREMRQYLRQVADGAPLEAIANVDGAVDDARKAAAYAIGEGLKRIFSKPMTVVEPAKMPSKMVAAFLSTLLFSVTCLIFLDWVRRGLRKSR